jgi:hypothetical protein
MLFYTSTLLTMLVSDRAFLLKWEKRKYFEAFAEAGAGDDAQVVALLLRLMVCGKRVTKSDQNRKSVWKFGHAGKQDVARLLIE